MIKNERLTAYVTLPLCFVCYMDHFNTLALVRNARTSVEMIDRFYAKLLSGEMNIEMLQSKRNRKIKDGNEPTAEWIKKLIEQALILTAMILSNKKHKANNS